MAQDYPQDAATEAFEALRAEVTQLRAGVESLSAKFQDQDPTDYAPTLGAIAMSLEAIKGHPALQAGPEADAQQFREATKLTTEQRQADLETAVKQGLIVGEYRYRKQKKELVTMTAAGVIAGAILWVCFSGLIARALPDGWQVAEQMAAATLGLDRWDAGAKLMEVGNPQAWARVVNGSQFLEDVQLEPVNRKTLDGCRAAASRTGKEQRCTVTLKVVNRPVHPPNS